jgi:phosphopantothenoylcysteine decarboxylase/phosphopantothenate--cysteine ligase
MLKNKKIVLCVSASIAAYKSAILTRLLVKSGAEVKIIMTPSAIDFITPLTLSTLSKNPVYSEYWDTKSGQWHNHVDLAQWADLILIAPASANTLAKMANGICDNLLLATYLSAKSKVAFAPAMDLDMYIHPAVKANISKLTEFGNLLIPAESGELASGLVGEGRMAEPETILNFVENYFSKSQSLKGKKALISAGPTFEKIDPVRYIGNHSSGKMGISIANELKSQGADVTLVLGPSNENNFDSLIKVIRVTSAEDMYNACIKEASTNDIMIMSAAVADYTPKIKSDKKIKKSENEMFIELAKTTDILKKLGEIKTDKQILVGFALETNNEYDNAVDKLNKKNLDFIVLNSLNDKGAGFQGDTNKITIIDKSLKSETFDLKTKKEVAKDIVNKIAELSK